jgi:HAD superfamily hydrolase (TIGR01490 family)
VSAVAVAAFDVDRTITRHDCVWPFLVRVGGRWGVARAVLRRPAATVRALLRRDRDALKEVVAGGVLRGRRVSDVAALGEAFAAEVMAADLRADVVDRLRWHQRAGHRIVIVSASMGPYLRPLGDRLGVDAVLCTDVVQRDGVYGDRLDGGNCRGPEKAVRLGAWLAAEGLSAEELSAYGDSSGDVAMLAMAPSPVWVADAVLDAAPLEVS